MSSYGRLSRDEIPPTRPGDTLKGRGHARNPAPTVPQQEQISETTQQESVSNASQVHQSRPTSSSVPELHPVPPQTIEGESLDDPSGDSSNPGSRNDGNVPTQRPSSITFAGEEILRQIARCERLQARPTEASISHPSEEIDSAQIAQGSSELPGNYEDESSGDWSNPEYLDRKITEAEEALIRNSPDEEDDFAPYTSLVPLDDMAGAGESNFGMDVHEGPQGSENAREETALGMEEPQPHSVPEVEREFDQESQGSPLYQAVANFFAALDGELMGLKQQVAELGRKLNAQNGSNGGG